MNNKLQGKDLINIGIFMAIYFIVIFAAASIGFIPIFIPLISVIVPLVGGIPMMLFFSKIKKFGMLTICGVLLGIIMLLTGMGWWCIPTGLIFGLISDFMMKACDYKNAKREVLIHGVFSMWVIGAFIPIVVTRDAYYQNLLPGYGQEYADTLMAYMPDWILPVLLIAAFVSGLVGGLIGRKIKKSILSGQELYNEPRTSCKSKNNSGILLDPRTKLAVLITIAVFILGGSYEGIMQYYIIVLAAIPLLLLSAARKWKGAVLYILIFGGSLCLEMFGLSRLTGVANYIAVAIVGILLRFTPSVVMGYFVVTTTTVSEFVAAMERLHLPQQITIPMSVMFRFFPTVAEEWSAIGDAMRMRGVRFGGGKVGAILEYRIVPMMICSVKIGEELSQAALTRGLGGPVKRTNICKLGFHVQDVIFLLICLGAFAAQIYVLAARG